MTELEASTDVEVSAAPSPAESSKCVARWCASLGGVCCSLFNMMLEKEIADG